MRIIHKDSKLGVSKVVWKFNAEPPAEAVREQVEDEPFISGSFEAAEEEQRVPITIDNQPESRDDHLADLRQQIGFLQQVIETQNQQLKTKDELLRNFQVLLKTEQEQVMRLEAGFVPKTDNENPPTLELTWFQSLKRKLHKQER